MKHPTLGRTSRYRLSLPPLSGGVDLSSPPHVIADDRLSDALNLWWQDGVLCTRPALCERDTLPALVGATYTATPLYRRTLLHGRAGEQHQFVLADEDGTLRGRTHTLTGATNVLALPAGRDVGFDDDCEAVVYVGGDDDLLRGVYALTSGADLLRDAAYVPKVLIAARPTTTLRRVDSGARQEPFNLLTNRFQCTYTSDGEGLYYWLPDTVTVDPAASCIVRHRDETGASIAHTIDYYDTDGLGKEQVDLDDKPLDNLALRYDPKHGCFWFVYATGGGVAPVPMGAASGNLTLTATRTDRVSLSRIYGMRFGAWFGGTDGTAGGTRLFLSGNPTCPSLIQWSALNRPTYFPENNFAYVGDASSAVTAFGKQSDLLVIFKEREVYATRYRAGMSYTADDLLAGTVTDTEAAAAVFPITQIHPERGCDCPDTVRLCGERLVWASSDGHVYTLFSGGTYDVRSVRALSAPIEAELAQYGAERLKAATAERVGDHYLLQIGTAGYALDCRSGGFARGGSYASEDTAQAAVAWQVWDTALGDAELLHLTRAGDTALSVVTVGDTLVSYGFDTAHACDRVPTKVGGTLTFAERPVACQLTTKWYALGQPAAYKQLCGVTLWLSGEAGERVTVSLCDGDTTAEVATLTLSGSAPEATLPRYLPTDAVRLCRCGINLRSSGRMTVDGIEVGYRRMGEIRR